MIFFFFILSTDSNPILFTFIGLYSIIYLLKFFSPDAPLGVFSGFFIVWQIWVSSFGIYTHVVLCNGRVSVTQKSFFNRSKKFWKYLRDDKLASSSIFQTIPFCRDSTAIFLQNRKQTIFIKLSSPYIMTQYSHLRPRMRILLQSLRGKTRNLSWTINYNHGSQYTAF